MYSEEEVFERVLVSSVNYIDRNLLTSRNCVCVQNFVFCFNKQTEYHDSQIQDYGIPVSDVV